MAKIYTKTGDDGSTGLFGGSRVSKADARIEAYGTVDELNSVLGCALALVDADEPLSQLLKQIQADLFCIGAELASTDPSSAGTLWRGDPRVAALEATIDDYQSRIPPLRSFILPGGTPLAAQLHLARAVCRRAERRVVAWSESAGSSPDIIVRFLNRLSDLLFVLARVVNHEAGQAETEWHPS